MECGVPVTLVQANSVLLFGKLVVQLDGLRVPIVTIYGGATTAPSTVEMVGYDNRNVRVISEVMIPVGSVVGSYSLGRKAVTKIESVTFSADPGQQVSIGTGAATVAMDPGTNPAPQLGAYEYVGLRFFCPRVEYLRGLLWWAGGKIAALPNIVPGNQFNPVTPTGYTGPSATSVDARGLVRLANTTPASVPADGTRMLSCSYYVYGADSYLQAQLANNDASAIRQTQILNTAINYGQMLEQDMVGLQYPGNYNPTGV